MCGLGLEFGKSIAHARGEFVLVGLRTSTEYVAHPGRDVFEGVHGQDSLGGDDAEMVDDVATGDARSCGHDHGSPHARLFIRPHPSAIFLTQ
jgi:hypothetical protein